MSMNNAETYRKMLTYLTNRGFDVGNHSNARVASMSHASLEELDRVDLQHYEILLEATMQIADEYMDKTAMAQELNSVKERLGHATADIPDNHDLPDDEEPYATCNACGDAIWNEDDAFKHANGNVYHRAPECAGGATRGVY